jgi:hypothetical protein
MTSVTTAEWTRPPPVPVMVSVVVPLGTLCWVDTVSTEVPETVRDEGVNAAVARLGKPLTVNPTAPEKPAPRVTVTVYVVDAPREIVRTKGVADSVKSPLTTSATLTLRLSGPLVPAIVNVYAPSGVAALVATLSVVEPDPVSEAGLNEAVAPEGSPVTLNFTVPLNPDAGVSVVV